MEWFFISILGVYCIIDGINTFFHRRALREAIKDIRASLVDRNTRLEALEESVKYRYKSHFVKSLGRMGKYKNPFGYQSKIMPLKDLVQLILDFLHLRIDEILETTTPQKIELVVKDVPKEEKED